MLTVISGEVDADKVDGHMQDQMKKKTPMLIGVMPMILTSRMKKKMWRRSRILHHGIMTSHLQWS